MVTRKQINCLNPYYHGTYILSQNKQTKKNKIMGLNPYYHGTYILSYRNHLFENLKTVLILIIMEHTFWVWSTSGNKKGLIVLILIIMEHTFWVPLWYTKCIRAQGLNPYYHGTYILRRLWRPKSLNRVSLNPYYHGTYILRIMENFW